MAAGAVAAGAEGAVAAVIALDTDLSGGRCLNYVGREGIVYRALNVKNWLRDAGGQLVDRARDAGGRAAAIDGTS